MPRQAITTNCTNALQLLEYLSPLPPGKFEGGNFIFRGQPDVEFELEPAAHRVDGTLTASNQHGTKDITAAQQVFFEIDVLRRFLKGCDAAGLVVPGDRADVREMLATQTMPVFYATHPSQWPPQFINELQAVAQHYGVPTSLLDWTRRSYVAAYFAASAALRMDMRAGDLAVWALDTGNCSEWKNLSLINVPGGNSSNLAAQAGLFTVAPTSAPDDKTFLPISLDYRPGLVLQCFTLPRSKAGQLLEACEKLGVSGATMFPGYAGVAQQVNDWARVNFKPYPADSFSLRELF